MSWIEAVFMTMRRHISSVAVSPPDSVRIRRTARMPMGVAALPRPSRFALRFWLIRKSRNRKKKGD